MRIAIQGDRGSFHEVAARQYFGTRDIEIIPFLTFDSTIDSVIRKNSDAGIMAIENARSGSILYNYSLIRESRLKVLGEHSMRINQNLMALPDQSISDIKEIWSHPVAISQCMKFLKHYPHINLVETDDTARSAKRISEEKVKGVAAIGSRIASGIYKLNILAESIETYANNYTRFVIVGDNNDYKEEANKASVCFSLGHQPGSLASLLLKLATLGINLTRIQSVPKDNMEWEYLFYLDLEFGAYRDIPHFIKLLEENTGELEILGIYNKNDKLYESTDC